MHEYSYMGSRLRNALGFASSKMSALSWQKYSLKWLIYIIYYLYYYYFIINIML